MKITPIKLAEALCIAKTDLAGRHESFHMFPHWKKLAKIEEAKVIIKALQLIQSTQEKGDDR